MKVLLGSLDLWDIVNQGYTEPASKEAEDKLSNEQKEELRNTRRKDKQALLYIYQGIDDINFEKIFAAECSKEAWEILRNAYRGIEKTTRIRLQKLRGEFKSLQMEEDKSISDYFNKITTIVNQSRRYREKIEDA